MLTLFAMILALVALDIAALRWSADSREDVHDPEWRRRQKWPGLTGRRNPCE
jgi:hypothetical protein